MLPALIAGGVVAIDMLFSNSREANPKTGAEESKSESELESKPEEFNQVAYAIGYLRSKRPTVDPGNAEQLEEWLAELNGYLEEIDQGENESEDRSGG